MQPLPNPGSVVRVRQRTWLVNDVVPPRADVPHESALVALSCLDDDAPGDPLEVLWHHELDAEVLPDAPELLKGDRLDDPRTFGAYLHAMQWNSVTSTDKRLLQSPFRAGIDLKAYQLEPLRKALELPRVNLFIADDVGLGKTIEAGLVLQELILRQRVDRVLVVAPPAVTVQWQEELDQRFGLPFVRYDSDFVAARRRERGWGVNPWSTAPHFIVSYALLRGGRARTSHKATNHLELLLAALQGEGARPAPRTLLILDECHQAAPSSGSMYAVDSRTTRAIRQLAPWFEHRLFLSATPHNGHSNSFSALLELLDPQRFTRGVPVQSAAELAPIMVRRLKRDLRSDIDGLPERILVDHILEELPPSAPEVALGRLLAQYDGVYRAAIAHLPRKEQLARSLVLVNLHKRLLSSVRAFHRTLGAHVRGVQALLAHPIQLPVPLAPVREIDEEAPSDEELDRREDDWVTAATLDPPAEAKALLDQMQALATEHREMPDARIRALASWIREHLCPDGVWNERRVVVFTEYEDTLQWLQRTLTELLRPAEMAGRVERYHGGQSEQKREELKAAFNTHPRSHRLRVLLATDAAREGINLQAHCTDLFHYDLPWNPSRIEQRNGRIDRVLQPSPQVWCHYFVDPNRPEDKVLAHVVRKMHVIKDELGSMSEVVSARVAERMERGIRDLELHEVDQLVIVRDAARIAQRELEGADAHLLRGSLDSLRTQLERSRRQLDYRREHLEDLVRVGLDFATGGNGALVERTPASDPPLYDLPPLDKTFGPVLDGMRPPRDPEDPPWKQPPVKPVAFRAAHRLDADAVQLHLGHPLVKRLVHRFRAQGFAAHDLSRVTVLENGRDHLRRIVGLGRLSLYGHGATRLHEEVLTVSGQIQADEVVLFKEAGERTTLEALNDALAQSPQLHTSAQVRQAIQGRAQADFKRLWSALREASSAQRAQAEAQLAQRGEAEAGELERLLRRQRDAIEDTLANPQLPFLEQQYKEEREQLERDRRAMERRLGEIDAEIATQPATLRRQYEVALVRFEPVGLVYLWPSS